MTQTHIKGADHVPTSIREQARALFTQHLGHHAQDFPEDEWFSLSEAWDLNLYVDDEIQQCRAIIYPVVDGRTDIRVGYPVYHLSQPTLQLLFFALRAYRDYDIVLDTIEEATPMDEYGVLHAFLTWVKAAPDQRYFAEETFLARFAEWENTLLEQGE